MENMPLPFKGRVTKEHVISTRKPLSTLPSQAHTCLGRNLRDCDVWLGTF